MQCLILAGGLGTRIASVAPTIPKTLIPVAGAPFAHHQLTLLARSGIDQQTLIRQERLYHKLLDAGFTLEQDERDSTGKRVSQSATGKEQFTPPDVAVDGRPATRFQQPSWSELRGLSSDERQLVLEYFKRINAQSP